MGLPSGPVAFELGLFVVMHSLLGTEGGKSAGPRLTKHLNSWQNRNEAKLWTKRRQLSVQHIQSENGDGQKYSVR